MTMLIKNYGTGLNAKYGYAGAVSMLVFIIVAVWWLLSSSCSERSIAMRGKKFNKVVQYVLLTLFFLILIGPLLWQLTLAFKGKGDDIYAIPPYLVPKDPTIDNLSRRSTRFRCCPISRIL